MYCVDSTKSLQLISHYSLTEAASLAGALCLVPQNLNFIARIETIAHCCIADIPRGRTKANRTNAEKLLRTLDSWVGQGDDPAENPATQGFTFHGGTFVFIAPTPESIFSLRILGQMTFPNPAGQPEIQQRLHGLITFCCHISQRCTSAGALQRNLPMPPGGRCFRVPKNEQLRFLQSAVTFSDNELFDLADQAEIERVDLEALCSEVKKSPIPELPYESDILGKKPFVRDSGTMVLVAPHRLADAVTALARSILAASPHSETLARDFHKRVLNQVTGLLDKLGLNHRFSRWRPGKELTQTQFSDVLFNWDDNRRAYVGIASDGCVGEEWQAAELRRGSDLGLSLHQHIFNAAPPPPVEHFNLLVLVPISGQCRIPMELDTSFSSNCIIFTAADLEALVDSTRHEDQRGLLARYLRARKRTEERCRIFSWKELDVFEAWRSNNYRFSQRATHIQVSSDMARTLREDACRNVDAHAVPGPNMDALVEVQRVEEPPLPIYMPRNTDYDAPCVVVKVGSHNIWILLQVSENNTERRSAIEFLKMTAFWLGQFSEALTPLAPAEPTTLVELFISEDDSLLTDAGFAITHQGIRRLRISAAIRFSERYGTDNSQERQYAFDLIRELDNVWGHIGEWGEEFSLLCERIAPLGPKRILHAFEAEYVADMLCKQDLPSPLLVHPADLAEIDMKLTPGQTKERVKDTLHQAVSELYASISREIKRFDASLLRSKLMQNNAALIADLAFEEVTIASQIACAGASESLVERLQKEARTRSISAIATRFLLEFVVSCPPKGTDHPGDFDVARLLAMATELIGMGTSSDIAEYELGQVSVKVDMDGYPVIEHGTFDGATFSAYESAFEERIQLESRRMTVPRAGNHSAEFSDEDTILLDVGMRDEFGVDFDEYRIAMGSILSMATKNSPIFILPKSELVTEVEKETQLQRRVVERLVDRFTLTPRKNFLKPPPPFQKVDVFPWRFNRRLSVLQRPLLQVDESIYLGAGQIHRSSIYMLNLIYSGRFKAESKAMKQAMSFLKNRSNEKFNDDVGEWFKDEGHVCRVRAKKFNGKHLKDHNGLDIGDIDVLAAQMEKRVIYAVECKNFEIDRTPHDVRTDLEELFLGSKGKPSTQDKHFRRAKWMEENLASIVSELKLPDEDWVIAPMMVVSRELRSPLLGHAKMPVVSWGRLQRDGFPES